MLKIKDKAIAQLWALRVSTLTADTAQNLETVLTNLPGVEEFTITLETQELHIVFDQKQLDVRTLVGEMTSAGCSLRNISAALLL